MRSTARQTSALLRNWLVFLLATVPAAGVVVAGSGPCFSVSILETIVLPDGATHDADSLRICVAHVLSPVTALHKVYVDREHVAMFVSSVGQSEAFGDGRPVIMFNRGENGRLHLYGFAAPDGGRMTTHLLRGSGFVPWRGRVSTKTSIAQTPGDGTVRIAVRDSKR